MPLPRTPILTSASLSQAVYDYATIHSILQTASILHVSFVPTASDPFPTILPMLGALGSFSSPDSPLDSEAQDLYLHGSSVARLMRLCDPTKDGGSYDSAEGGIPLAVAATHVDGFVLALSAFHSSANYRSAVVHGYGSLVMSPEERLYAMELITNNIMPGRWEGSRNPPLKTELTATGILKVRIVSASAKVRTGVADEERKDLRDEEVTGRVWAGTVPMWVQRGEPVEAEHNMVELPGYLRGWVEAENAKGQAYAEEAAVEDGK